LHLTFSLDNDTEALEKGANDRVMACGHQGGHVEGGSHSSPPAPNGTLAPETPAVPLQGSNSHQCSDLSPVQGAQFGEVSQEGNGKHRAHSGHALEQIVFLLPDRAFPNAAMQVLVDSGQLLFQPGDMGADPGLDRLAGHRAQTVSFCCQHPQQLPPAGQEGAQLLGLGLWKRARVRMDGSREMGQYPDIDGIGLSQTSHGPGEIPCLAGVHYRHRNAGHCQGGDQRRFNASAGLQDHQHGRQLLKARNSLRDPAIVVGKSPALVGGVHRNVDPPLGDVDAHVCFSRECFLLLLGPSLQDVGLASPDKLG